VKVTDRRTAEDFATCMRELTDGHFPADDNRVSLAVSKCSLIQNTCRSYDEPRSTSQNLCAELLRKVGQLMLVNRRPAREADRQCQN
jgi:hypothetical protein